MTQQVESTEARHDALRVVIVDDHDLFRTGLRNLLEEQGIQVVGEAAAGSDDRPLVPHTRAGDGLGAQDRDDHATRLDSAQSRRGGT